MEQYLSLVMLAMPGFFARKFESQLGHARRIENNFVETMWSLFYSVPVWYLSMVFLQLFSGQKKASLLLIATDIVSFGIYIVVAIISIFILGFIAAPIKQYLLMLVNKIRVKRFVGLTTGYSTIWDDFLVDGKQHLISVSVDEKIFEFGVVDVSSSGVNQRQELMLKKHEWMTAEWFEQAKASGEIKELKTYLCFDTKTVIVEYDMTWYKQENADNATAF